MKKVIIITPTYNEEINISNFILEVENIMASIAIDYDHFIIDNSSTDRTQSIIKEIDETQNHYQRLRVPTQFLTSNNHPIIMVSNIIKTQYA